MKNLVTYCSYKYTKSEFITYRPKKDADVIQAPRGLGTGGLCDWKEGM